MIRFLPRVNLERSFITDAVSRERMTGIAYSQSPFSTPDPRAEPCSEAMQQQPVPPAVDHRAVANGNGSAAGMHGGELVASSSNRRKYPSPFKLAIHPSMHSCAMDEIFPPPPDYRGSNNPFHTDPNAPPTVPDSRGTRFTKRIISADENGNGRGKKKKLNNGVGVRMLGPTASRNVAPRSVAIVQPMVRASASVDIQESVVQTTSTNHRHSRNLRPRSATNYSDRRRYRPRRDLSTVAEESDGTGDGEISFFVRRSRSLSVSSTSSSATSTSSTSCSSYATSASSSSSSTTASASAANPTGPIDCIVTLPNGEIQFIRNPKRYFS